MRVLVVGANGFLGTELCKVLSERGHEVLRGVRIKLLENEIEVPLNGTISIPVTNFPDIVIDVSNRYIPGESDNAMALMSETITGVSETLSKSNQNWKVPIFQTSSYLQHCPDSVQPWNHYSLVRNKSLETLKLSANSHNQGFFEFVLHDTYGEASRNKFLDLCLEAIKTEEPFAAGEGKSVVNLTHINDICIFIADQIQAIVFGSEANYRWDLKSSDTYTLKSLVQLLEDLSNKHQIVHWGELANPRREVLEVWEIPDALSTFKNTTILKEWLHKKISKGL